MHIVIHSSVLPHDSLAFYRDVLGFEVNINLATADLDGTFERLQAGDADVVQEPPEQPYGLRDCALRDPAGNLIRVQQPA